MYIARIKRRPTLFIAIAVKIEAPPPQPLIHSLIRRFRSVSSQAPHGFTAHSFRLSRCSGSFNMVYTRCFVLAPGVLIFYLQDLFWQRCQWSTSRKFIRLNPTRPFCPACIARQPAQATSISLPSVQRVRVYIKHNMMLNIPVSITRRFGGFYSGQ